MAVALSENRQSRYGEAEWQVRVDLAACYRLVALNRMADQIYTHITAAVPGPDRHFLINPYGMMFDEVTASSLIKVDLEGRPQEDSPYEINPAGYVIHSCVHAARHDVKCVLHTHSRSASSRLTRHGTSGSCWPCSRRTGQRIGMAASISRWFRPSSISRMVMT